MVGRKKHPSSQKKKGPIQLNKYPITDHNGMNSKKLDFVKTRRSQPWDQMSTDDEAP